MKLLLCSLAALFSIATTAHAATIENERIETASGAKFTVLSASAAEPTHGIVLVHDWFGVSPFYRETISRLADSGYSVAAVDLYDGASATTHQEAWKLMSALDQSVAAEKVDAAVALLQERGFVAQAVFGFSMGAPIALGASLRHGDVVKASVLFYGDTINDPERLAGLGGPVLLVVGSKDGDAAAAAATFSQATDAAGKLAEVFIYPGAHHAFAQPLFNQGATYDADAAEVAWRLARDFFKRRLP
jgi:carboxymethylenebutenolidase